MTKNSKETGMAERNGPDPDEGTFSSPPCFMHEVAPEYLGYMSNHETAVLLAELVARARACPGADTHAVAVLTRHLASLGVSERNSEPGGRASSPRREHAGEPESSTESQTCAAERLRRSLPRIQPSPLRDDLEDLLRRWEVPRGDLDTSEP